MHYTGRGVLTKSYNYTCNAAMHTRTEPYLTVTPSSISESLILVYPVPKRRRLLRSCKTVNLKSKLSLYNKTRLTLLLTCLVTFSSINSLQKQPNSNDCSVFAIFNTLAICAGHQQRSSCMMFRWCKST